MIHKRYTPKPVCRIHWSMSFAKRSNNRRENYEPTKTGINKCHEKLVIFSWVVDNGSSKKNTNLSRSDSKFAHPGRLKLCPWVLLSPPLSVESDGKEPGVSGALASSSSLSCERPERIISGLVSSGSWLVNGKATPDSVSVASLDVFLLLKLSPVYLLLLSSGLTNECSDAAVDDVTLISSRLLVSLPTRLSISSARNSVVLCSTCNRLE